MALLRRYQHKNTLPLEVPRNCDDIGQSYHKYSITTHCYVLVTLLNKHKFITQWKCFQNIQVSNLFISLFILLLSLNLCTLYLHIIIEGENINQSISYEI